MPTSLLPIERTQVVMPSTPGWVTQGAVADYDFVNQLFWQQGNPSGGLTVNAIGSQQYALWADGHVTLLSDGTLPATDLGLQIWDASTNFLLNTNDFTQASWTKTNMTAVLNQTGPDNVANSASQLTATAANATATQSYTSASAINTPSIFIKRITGSGAVSLTVNNGVNYNTVTVTSNWSQVNAPSRTLANPTFGIKLATSGDSVAVWCAQAEQIQFLQNSYGVATAPMPTGFTTRNLPSIFLPLFNSYSGTFLVVTNGSRWTSGTGLCPTGASFFMQDSSATQVKSLVTGITITATAGSGNTNSGICKRAYAQDNTGRSLCVNAGTVVSDAHNQGPNQCIVGETQGTPNCFNGFIQRITVWPNRLSNSSLQAVTT
jgi:hypothetical protein